MILTRMKRLLQSVEEATPRQIAADLGVDRGMAAATLEHLCAMGKVVRRSPSSAAETLGSGLGECGERIGCASCPLVRVCDSQSDAGTSAGPGATRLEEEVLYAWATN